MPSERQLAASVLLIAIRVPSARHGKAAQMSPRPWSAAAPPSSHDTAPLAPRYVAVVKRWAAGASVNALKLEPPAYLTKPAPTPSEACCCAKRAMGAIARHAENETGPKCMGPVRYSATKNRYA
jgi:hypothetical protein